jgi:hypothetical protein
VGELCSPTASPVCIAQTGLRVPTCVGSKFTAIRGRRSGPLAGSVGRGYQVRWCHLHSHLLDLRGPTTVRDTRSHHRNSSVLPRSGHVKRSPKSSARVAGDSHPFSIIEGLSSRRDGAHLALPCTTGHRHGAGDRARRAARRRAC